MTNAKKMPSELRFVFTRALDYKIIPANGVWGGVTPRGDFRMEFFIEHTTDPKEITQKINPDGRLGEIIQRKGDGETLTREITGAVLMTVEQAENIANWIKERIKVVRKDTKKNEGAGV